MSSDAVLNYARTGREQLIAEPFGYLRLNAASYSERGTDATHGRACFRHRVPRALRVLARGQHSDRGDPLCDCRELLVAQL